MTRLLIVALGGAIGSAARYVISGWVLRHTTPYFPTGTLAVNALGCFVVGLVAGLAAERAGLFTPSTRLLLVVGICGGFTTFSTFGYETIELLRANEVGLAFVNVGGQLFAGLAAVWAGLALSRL
jgi:fluoride exporter